MFLKILIFQLCVSGEVVSMRVGTCGGQRHQIPLQAIVSHQLVGAGNGTVMSVTGEP